LTTLTFFHKPNLVNISGVPVRSRFFVQIRVGCGERPIAATVIDASGNRYTCAGIAPRQADGKYDVDALSGRVDCAAGACLSI
jgi:hypothetical protein